MQKNRIKEVITLYTSKFLNFYQVGYQNKIGQDKRWFVASRKDEETIRKQLLQGQEDAADAVVLVAIHEKEQKLVLIKQFRVPLNDYIYELPAGLIDPGEEMTVSAARELKEETGLILTHIDKEKCIDKAYLSPGMTDESVGVVYCQCKGELSQEYMEADEDIQPMLIDQEQAKAILQSGEKIDIKAAIVLQQFIMSK